MAPGPRATSQAWRHQAPGRRLSGCHRWPGYHRSSADLHLPVFRSPSGSSRHPPGDPYSHRREWLRQPRVVWRSSARYFPPGRSLLLLSSPDLYIPWSPAPEPGRLLYSQSIRVETMCRSGSYTLTALLPVSAIYQSPPRLTRSPGSLSRASPDIPLR